MAQALLEHYLKQHHFSTAEWQIWSAGLQTADGLPASPEALEVLVAENINLNQHRSSLLTDDLMNQADYILTMSVSQCRTLKQRYPHMKNIAAIKQFAAGEPGDIVDPYGQGIKAYQCCMQELKKLIPGIVARVAEREDITCK
jgi:protein-tyrosine phosphatase